MNKIKSLLEDIHLIISEIEKSNHQPASLTIDLLNKKIIDLYDHTLLLKTMKPAQIVKEEIAQQSITKEVEEHIAVVEEEEPAPEPEVVVEEAHEEVHVEPEQEVVETNESEHPDPVLEVKMERIEENTRELPPLKISEELKEAVQEQVHKKALHETFARQEKSLNERIGSTNSKMALGDSLQKGPITDIKTAITLNMKLTLIKELYKGDQKEYKRFIDFLTRCQNYSEAKLFLQDETEKHTEWAKKTELLEMIMDLITRRFRV